MLFCPPNNAPTRWTQTHCPPNIIPSLFMKILIVGSGGREHALAWKASQSPKVQTVYVAPGNAGTALEDQLNNVALSVEDIDGLLNFAQQENIGLTIIGAEVPLVAGIVDAFQAAG